MGIILGDLTREDRDLKCNWWNWRPTLKLVEQSGVIDADRLERMEYNGGGAEVSAEKARQIADFVATEVLPNLRAQEAIKPMARFPMNGAGSARSRKPRQLNRCTVRAENGLKPSFNSVASATALLCIELRSEPGDG